MLPRTLAWIDDDTAYAHPLSRALGERGIAVSLFKDASAWHAAGHEQTHEFYIVDLMQRVHEGFELIQRLRARSNAGLVVVSSRPTAEVFTGAVRAGADMVLDKPASLDLLTAAIQAVQRRAARDTSLSKPWQLDRAARELRVPDGARVALSEADVVVLDCLLEAAGQTVTREALSRRLGRESSGDNDNGLNAIIYRLRRRIERATPMLVPLQSRSRVGYLFRAPLQAV